MTFKNNHFLYWSTTKFPFLLPNISLQQFQHMYIFNNYNICIHLWAGCFPKMSFLSFTDLQHILGKAFFISFSKIRFWETWTGHNSRASPTQQAFTCSKLTIQTPKQYVNSAPDVSIVEFDMAGNLPLSNKGRPRKLQKNEKGGTRNILIW